MITVGCILIICFFAWTNVGLYTNPETWAAGDKAFYLLCYELPLLRMFIAHWIVFYQYLELAVIMPVLIKIAEYA